MDARLLALVLVAACRCSQAPPEPTWVGQPLEVPPGRVTEIDVRLEGGALQALTSGEDGRVFAYDIETGSALSESASPSWWSREELLRELGALPRFGEVVCVAAGKDEIAAGFESGAIWRWPLDALSGPPGRLPELAGHASRVTALAYADGPYLLSGDEEGRLRVWFTAEATLLAELPTEGRAVAGAGWDGLRPLAIDARGIYLVFELSGALTNRRDTGLGDVAKAVHAGGGRWVVLDAAGRAFSVLFDSDTTLLDLESRHRATIASLLLDEAAGKLAAWTEDGRLRTYEWPAGRVVGEDRVEVLKASIAPLPLPAGLEPTGRATATARSADGRLVAAGTAEGWVSVWEVESGRRISHRKVRGGPIRCIALHPGEHWTARGEEGGRVVLEREPDGMEVASWRAHDGEVNALLFAEGGRALITAGRGSEPLVVWRRVD
ncbi:MAG: hypothetical protein HY720_24740 [Planctomycetes bacterium]|nr:hypothetical protein [Planctomycetota bacterium]